MGERDRRREREIEVNGESEIIVGGRYRGIERELVAGERE